MPRSENQKLKLLYLKELFEAQSDEQHILSMQDIVSYLAARGIRAERKSVYGDIACLQEFGMDIVLQKGPGGGYFLASRPFELAELKLLAGGAARTADHRPRPRQVDERKHLLYRRPDT